MKTSLLLILALLPVRLLFATAQMPERIEYKGETLSMFSTPLEDAFSKDRPRPDNLFEFQSTANWRGYIGHWKIEEDQLLLTALYRERYEKDAEGKHTRTKELIPLDKVLGAEAAYPMKADWFTGTLRFPRGELVRYVHMGFGSQYEKELLIKIEAGKIIHAVEIAHDPEKDAYRSSSDMQWVALGEGLENTTGDADWIDGRLLPTPVIYPFMQNKQVFKTRGIFFTDEEGPYLWIPETKETRPLNLPIHKSPPTEIAKGSHVEIEARFYLAGENFELEATSIRPLKPGETIHHSSFPAQLKEIRSQDESDPKQADPSPAAATSTPVPAADR